MKALIIIRENECGWLRQFFPLQHPGMIRICNKPLLEFLVDFSVINACSALRIVMDESDMDVEHYFKQGELWGIDISYGNAMEADSLEVILKKNSAYCASTPLLVMDGFFFIHYNKAENYTHSFEQFSTCQTILSCGRGTIQYIPCSYFPLADTRHPHDIDNIDIDSNNSDKKSSLNGHQIPETPDKSTNMDMTSLSNLSLSPLKTLNDLIQINMQIIEHEQPHYVLPGYGTEQGVTIGSNVEINRTTQIIQPVILGSNVRLMDHAVIGPHAVIGSNVIIDTESHIKRSVILDGSYVGKNLTVEEKIVDGSTVLSTRYEEKLIVEDAFLLSPMQPSRIFSPVRIFLNSTAALLLAMFQLVPFIILGIVRKMQDDWQIQQKSFLIDSRGNTRQFDIIQNNPDTIAGKLFILLSLDKFPLSGAVLLGKLKLMGNQLLEANPLNRERLQDFREYLPGIYSYSEGEGVEAETPESEITERFYAVNRSFLKDINMLIKAISNR